MPWRPSASAGHPGHHPLSRYLDGYQRHQLVAGSLAIMDEGPPYFHHGQNLPRRSCPAVSIMLGFGPRPIRTCKARDRAPLSVPAAHARGAPARARHRLKEARPVSLVEFYHWGTGSRRSSSSGISSSSTPSIWAWPLSPSGSSQAPDAQRLRGFENISRAP